MSNILEILGVQNKEDVISNLLRYCINSSRDFASAFLTSVCGKDIKNYTGVEAFTRFTTSAGVPDIIVNCTAREAVDIFIIENKIKAEEGEDQTERYASIECLEDIKKRLNLHDKTVTPSYIFLTLFPDQEPRSNAFKKITYLELQKALKSSIVDVGPLVHQLAGDLAMLLEKFYSYENTSPDDDILEKLRAEDGLDASYLYFKSIIYQLKLPADLEVEGTFKDSRQGRRYYGALISKEAWHPAELNELANAKWSLNPTKCFNIHIEPQFNVLSGIMNIFLHYEINPYETEAWAMENIKENEYQEYLARRGNFINVLSAANVDGLFIGGGSNQVAKAAFEIKEGMQFKGALEMMGNFINKVSVEIDKALLTQ